MKSAGEQIGTRIQRTLVKPGLDGLACLLGQFELDRPGGFLLHDYGPFSHAVVRDDIAELQGHQVAIAQLAIEGEVKQRKVTSISLKLEADTNGPNLLGHKRGFLSDQLPPAAG
jgi:hypothetical protein